MTVVTTTDAGWYSGDRPLPKGPKPDVVSIYAFREDKFGVDYDDCLDVLQASCDRLGLRHVCISDQPRPRVETFLCDLPQNTMQMILAGQLAWLRHTDGPTFFVGADCIVTADPTGIAAGYDMAITTEHYARINTGAMWCSDACIPAFEKALELNPVEWGDDQPALLKGIRYAQQVHNLKVRELPCGPFNWHTPEKTATSGIDNPPMVVHFKGKRKHLMKPWWENYTKARWTPSLAEVA